MKSVNESAQKIYINSCSTYIIYNKLYKYINILKTSQNINIIMIILVVVLLKNMSINVDGNGNGQRQIPRKEKSTTYFTMNKLYIAEALKQVVHEADGHNNQYNKVGLQPVIVPFSELKIVL